MKDWKQGDTGWVSLPGEAIRPPLELASLLRLFRHRPQEVRVVSTGVEVEGSPQPYISVNPASRTVPDGKVGGFLLRPESIHGTYEDLELVRLASALDDLRVLVGDVFELTTARMGIPRSPFEAARDRIVASLTDAAGLVSTFAKARDGLETEGK